MFGTFQQSCLRIEIPAPEQALRESLTQPEKMRQWLAPFQVDRGLPSTLQPGMTFTSRLGVVAITHQVDQIEGSHLRLLLSQGIDGFHEWHWGDGWVQSRLEGVSLLPLNLGQTVSLMRLRQFLQSQSLA